VWLSYLLEITEIPGTRETQIRVWFRALEVEKMASGNAAHDKQ